MIISYSLWTRSVQDRITILNLWCFFPLFFVSIGGGVESWASCMLVKYSVSELHSSALGLLYYNNYCLGEELGAHLPSPCWGLIWFGLAWVL